MINFEDMQKCIAHRFCFWLYVLSILIDFIFLDSDVVSGFNSAICHNPELVSRVPLTKLVEGLSDDVYRLSRYQIINYIPEEKVMGIKYLLMMSLMGKSVAASVQNAMNP